jgi:hypothetical protein
MTDETENIRRRQLAGYILWHPSQKASFGPVLEPFMPVAV